MTLRNVPVGILLASLGLIAGGCGGSGGGVAAVATLGTPQAAPSNGASARSLVVGDLDGDGLPDAVVADPVLGIVMVLRGSANGGLQPGVGGVSLLGAGSVALAELDGDRLLDLVVASGATGAYAIARGLGNGSFAAPVGGTLPWPATQIMLRDVTADGFPDLVAIGQLQPEFAVLPGTGAGTFGAAITVTLPYVPTAMVAGDFDGDQRIDVATTRLGAGQIDVWRSAGGGNFLPAVTTASTLVLGGTLAAGDFDSDGRLDLVAMAQATGELILLRGTSGGALVAADTTFLTMTAVDSLAVGDFDGDGWLDAAAAAGAGVHVAFGAATTWRTVEAVAVTPPTARSLVGHDLLGDGRWELLFVVGVADVGTVGKAAAARAGLQAYGQGTPDCAGAIGMWANGIPRVGNTDYAYTVSNAPRSTFGFLLQGGPADIAGSDPFGIGLRLHLGLGFVTSELVFTDAIGRAVLPRPLPSDVGLIGLPVHVQTLWQAPAFGSCSRSSAGVASSIGLVSTVQP